MEKIIKKMTAVLLSLSFVIASFSLAVYSDIDLFGWLKANAYEYTNGFYYIVENGEVTITYGHSYGNNYRGNVVIPEQLAGYPVTKINNKAFYNCMDLRSIIIPDSVTSIGDEAFNLCNSLKSVSIGKGVTEFGEGVFKICRSLESITLPDDITSIPDSTFFDCEGLTEITFSNSISSIDRDAFYLCKNLTDINFYGSDEDWESITIDSTNNTYLQKSTVFFMTSSISGECGENLMWTIDPNTGRLVILGKGDMENWSEYSAPWYKYRKLIKSISVHDGVTGIGDNAFSGLGFATSVIMPKTLERIGTCAFSNCTGLTNVLISENVISLGCGVFKSCEKLERVYMNCNKLTEIPDTAFADCYSLCFINIPYSVKTIGDSSFAHCTELKKITLPYGSIIGNNAFRSCSNLAIIDLNHAESIEPFAFYNCDNLSSIEIPDTVVNIGGDAFEDCDNLTLVRMQNGKLTEFNGNIFASCPALQMVEIPSNVTNVSSYAFRNTEGFTVLCEENSYAHQYCIDNSIEYMFSSVNKIYEGVDSALFNNHTYVIYNDDVSWTEAEKICEFLGGHLAVVTSAEEKAVITKLVSENTDSSKKGYWLGANDSNQDGTWEWITGELFDYKYWDEYEPNNKYGNEYYLEQYVETSKWNDESGTSLMRGFICEFEDLGKPVDVEFTEDSIYVVYDDSLSWTKAKTYCENIGGHLVTITSAEEQKVVENLKKNKKLYWIGLTDSETEGVWKWVTGEKYSYTNWGDKEPSGSSTDNQDYGQIYSESRSELKPAGSWNDDYNEGNSSSTDKYYQLANVGFICEIPLKNITPVATGYHGNSYYEVYDKCYAWHDAELISESKGGHLAVITDENEDAFVKKLISSGKAPNGYWYGASDSEMEGVWLNVTGENFSYSNFSHGNPNNGNGGTEDYLEYYITNAAWNDAKNTTTGRGFVVEYDLPTAGLWLYETDDTFIQYAEIPCGIPLDFPAVEKAGYTVEWYDDEDLTIPWDFDKPVAYGENVILYAKWTPEEYEANLNPNGGMCKTVRKNVLYCKPYSSLPVPIRQGYTFDGWYTKPDGGEKITFDTPMINAYDHEIYAHWIPESVNVTLDSNGGILSGSESDKFEIEYGSTYGNLPIPQKSKHKFVGWYLSDGVTEITSDSIVETLSDHTLYAKWTESEIVQIEIASLPDKKDYILNETLNTYGLSLNVIYDNGEIAEITEGYLCSLDKLESLGSCTVTVTYEGFETDFEVNVSKGIPVKISVNTLPIKMKYRVGDPINTRRLTLLAEYADGSQEIISEGYECSLSEFSKAGTQKVTVTYQGCKTSFNVTVVEGNLVNITVQNLPDKLNYFIGEELDTTGLVLKAEYVNSVYKTVSEGFETDCDLNSVGTKTVDVTYAENGIKRTTSFTVEVTVAPDSTIISSLDMSANSGETVSVPVTISKNPGLMGFSIIVEYNSDVFTPVSVNVEDMLISGTFDDSIGGAMPEGKLKITYNTDKNIYNDGTMFTVDFAVDKNASSGDYPIGISYIQNDTFNEEFENVEFVCVGNTVSIKNIVEDSMLNFYSDPVTVEVGKELSIPVFAGNAKGLTDFVLTFRFNSEILKFKEIKSEFANEIIDNGSETITLKFNNSEIGTDNLLLFNLVFDAEKYVDSKEIIEILCVSATVNGVSVDAICSDVELTILKSDSDDSFVIYSDKRIIPDGEFINIPVYINNNHGIMGFGMNVFYDSQILEPVSITTGDALSKGDFFYNIESASSNISILWNHTENATDNGLLYILKFKVSDIGSLVDIPVAFSYSQADTFNENWEDVLLNIKID
ncbi:MAG: leucine-rich repeat protein, partial [Acutalibacteraceae bacterium]|nr:leucine-rich repeat protein [Acutalibacteraceae bacterium]